MRLTLVGTISISEVTATSIPPFDKNHFLSKARLNLHRPIGEDNTNINSVLFSVKTELLFIE